MSCEGCGTAAEQTELNLSGAGQWLCRSCLALYEVQLATRRQHEAQVYRRCTCGASLGPRDEMDVPLYHRSGTRKQSLNLEYAFRRSVYDCSCGQHFKLLHPVLVWTPLLVFSVCAIIARGASEGRLAGWLVGGALCAALLIPDLYFRLRFPAVR